MTLQIIPIIGSFYKKIKLKFRNFIYKNTTYKNLLKKFIYVIIKIRISCKEIQINTLYHNLLNTNGRKKQT